MMQTITTKDGTEVYYNDWGKGQPLVSSHGWPLSAEAREDQMIFLAGRGYRCIAKAWLDSSDWYKQKPYRARAVKEPRAVLAEFDTVIPDDVEIRLSDSTAAVRYLVLPLHPAGTEGWSEEELAALVTRDTMIGVATIEQQSRRIQ
jgi:hypothetical protein